MTAPPTYYATSAALDAYLECHWSSESLWSIPNHCVRLSDLVRRNFTRLPCSTGLDLGCGVGRLSYELASICDHVVGVDSSASFIDAAAHLGRGGRVDYSTQTEVDLHENASIDGSNWSDAQFARVEFVHADVECLPSPIREATYDVVVIANVLDRVKEPKNLIDISVDLLTPGGILLVSSPWGWSEEYTPRHLWLRSDTGEGSSWEYLCDLLSVSCQLEVGPIVVPMALREWEFRYQLVLPQVGVWRRRE